MTDMYLHAFCLNEGLGKIEVLVGPLEGWGITYDTIRAADAPDGEYEHIFVRDDERGLWYLASNILHESTENRTVTSMLADASQGRFSDIYSEQLTEEDIERSYQGVRRLTVAEIAGVTYTPDEAAHITQVEQAWDKQWQEDYQKAEAAFAKGLATPRLDRIVSIQDLYDRAHDHGPLDCRLYVAGGAAFSRKTIDLVNERFEVFNHIDDTYQELDVDGLSSESNIAAAIEAGAFYEVIDPDAKVVHPKQYAGGH